MPDILTCGVCQKHFPLAEIVRFIQHKVQLCNKENNCLGPLLYEGDSGEEDNNHPANLVLPKKEPEEKEEETKCPPIKEEQVSSSSIIKMALSAKDATVNTNENSHGEKKNFCYFFIFSKEFLWDINGESKIVTFTWRIWKSWEGVIAIFYLKSGNLIKKKKKKKKCFLKIKIGTAVSDIVLP